MFSLKKSLNRALLAVLVLSLLTAFFTGCKNGSTDDVNNPGTLPAELVGTWTDDMFQDYYTITSTTITYFDGDSDTINFDIAFVSNYTDSSGVLIVEYTSGDLWSFVGYDWNALGPFFAIYYKNFDGNSVEMSIAIHPDYSPAGKPTEAGAIAEFTKSRVGNYISFWGGPYE